MKIGILGSGQLGQMLKTASTRVGVNVALYDLTHYSSATLYAFLQDITLLTFETENVSGEILDLIENSGVQTAPSINAIRICQHRLKEKRLLRSLGIPTADFAEVTDYPSLLKAVETLSLPLILKTQTEGYDGKGQAFIHTEHDIEQAWAQLQGKPLIAEKFVIFTRELSAIAVRNTAGDIRTYDLAENHHYQGILRYSIAPAPKLTAELIDQAQRYIFRLLTEFNYCGVIALELFDTADGLVANEIAPRVHNSGHWSIEGAHTSQFENHIRAISDEKLGSIALKHPLNVMINVIGDETPCVILKKKIDAHFHSYGKSARPARKLGHVTITGDNASTLAAGLIALQELMPEPLHQTEEEWLKLLRR